MPTRQQLQPIMKYQCTILVQLLLLLLRHHPSYDYVSAFGVLHNQHKTRPNPMLSTSSRTESLSNNNSNNGVQTISLDNLGNNHTAIGNDLALSVQTMLDQEWMPQQIHVLMGQSVKESYIKVRTSMNNNDNNDNDDDMIMTIMTTVADDLTDNWSIYNKDAFVNAWDIANYVSDYLTTRINNNSSTPDCACTLKIY